MRVDTRTGLHGELIEYVEKFRNDVVIEAKAIVLKDDPTFPAKPYSTHILNESGGALHAYLGHYDMSLEEAREDLRSR